MLPRVVFTTAHQKHCSTATTFTPHSHQRLHSKHRRELGEASSWRRPATTETEGKPPQISPERKLPSIPTGGGDRGVGATVLPQVSTAEATGVGRNGRATTAAI
jgi:hypothetical protein